MPKVYSETFKKEGLNIDDFQIVPVSGGGVCGTNAIALHIYWDESHGRAIREEQQTQTGELELL